jgi:hypothetical protein
MPWSWQAAAIGRSLESIEASMARDGRVIQLVDGGPEAVVASVIGGATAGYRLLGARLADPDEDAAGLVELVPPGGLLPPGPRTRANVELEPLPGGAGDTEMVVSQRLFSPPEKLDDRPFSAADTARTVTEVAVETLRARGEPAPYDRLIGEILVGLDRAGQLRSLATATSDPDAAHDPVERLLALIRDEFARSTQRRLVEIEPGRWWLADPDDLEGAAPPLADRVEWAVFSLLSTAGPMTEAAFFDRIASLFGGHDQPDDGLVRACLASYRSLASTPGRLVTGDDLLRRSQEHTELLATIAEAGHRLGMRVWIGRREQTRRHGTGLLGDLLDAGEQRGFLGAISSAVEDVAEVDGIWYIRGKVAFLFEVEWTAMLGEPLLRRHGRIPPDESLIRFLVIAPERTELVRYKLERSPLLRAALDSGTWHIIKSVHLRTFLARDPLDLADLEPYLGLDPPIERSGEQMPLFGGGVSSPTTLG